MSTARDYLAAVQQRAKSSGTLSELGERLVELEETTDRLVAALTAVLDLAETNQYDANQDRMGFTPVLSKRTIRAAITDALTPKENS